jgi:hypothetical protein
MRSIGRVASELLWRSSQKSRAFEADLDKGRLHAGQHTHHLAHVDVADDATAAGTFDVQFLHHALLHQRHPRFHRGDVDQIVIHA